MVWSKKRKRYVFRKRSRWTLILWLGLGSLVVVGLSWSIPWPTLPLVDLEDTPKVQTSQDQPEQADNDGATENRPEQGSTGGDSKDEKAPEATPSNEEVGSSDLSSSSSFAQTSPPPQAPSALPSEAAPGAQEVRMTSVSPNDYWYTEPGYQYFGPGYWDYGWDYYDGDNYYWEY